MSRLKGTKRDEDSGHRDAFGYNAAGELTGVNYDESWNGTAWISPARIVSYALDTAGNRDGSNGVSENGIGTSFTVASNNLNQYSAVGGNAVTNGNQHELTELNSPTYGTVNYAYLADGPLVAASSSTDGVYTLGYDALGRTVRRTLNGQTTNYAFDGARAIVEFNPAQSNLSAAVVASNVYGIGIDEVIARNSGGTGQWLMQDRLGSTSAVTNANGEVIEWYRYDAFGTPTIRNGDNIEQIVNGRPTSAINNRFLFTGREWVSRFGFYEYRARAYNPRLGRFMSEDPLGFKAGDRNLFRYCGGDPVNRVDPMGLADVPVDRKLDIAIVKACYASLLATRSNGGLPHATVVIESGGTYRLGRPLQGVARQQFNGGGSVLPDTKVRERFPPGKYAAVGHDHKDIDSRGRINKVSSDFTPEDRLQARTVTVGKVNHSRPNEFRRLGPQLDKSIPQGKGTLIDPKIAREGIKEYEAEAAATARRSSGGFGWTSQGPDAALVEDEAVPKPRRSESMSDGTMGHIPPPAAPN